MANAQPYPTKSVRLVVPSSPGAGVDASARVLSQKLSETWKHQLLVDNRTSAGTRRLRNGESHNTARGEHSHDILLPKRYMRRNKI